MHKLSTSLTKKAPGFGSYIVLSPGAAGAIFTSVAAGRPFACWSATLLSGSELWEVTGIHREWERITSRYSLCRLPHPQLCGSASTEVGGSVLGKEWREAASSNYVFFALLQAKPLTFRSKNGSVWSHSLPGGMSVMSSSPSIKGKDLFLTGDNIVGGLLCIQK